MGLQRFGLDWMAELDWTESIKLSVWSVTHRIITKKEKKLSYYWDKILKTLMAVENTFFELRLDKTHKKYIGNNIHNPAHFLALIKWS